MFNKLRNKFLILGMTVTSLVLITAFTVIYAVMYDSVQQNNMKKLSESSLNAFLPNISGLPDEFRESLSHFLLPSDYRPSFTLLLDKNGKVIEKYSLIDMSEEDYAEAAQKAWQRQDSKTPIRVNGRMWQYTVSGSAYYIIRSAQSHISTEGYQAAFLDVTESHQTLRELFLTFLIVGICTLIVVFAISLFFANNAVKPIRSAWEAQKRFIADASHELKTPLTIINSNYGALNSKKNETIESQIKWLNYIKDGADRMDKLIGDLLYLAKTESAQLNMDSKPSNLSNIVRNEIHSMEFAAHEKGLTIEQDIKPDIIVNYDGEKLGRVVRILLDNAIKYSNENGFIHINLRYEKHNITFLIKNTGCGIPEEHLPKIFDRFYRSDTSRTHNGSYGLGLSIAKAILDNMDGKINATSIEGESAAFVVTLPKI